MVQQPSLGVSDTVEDDVLQEQQNAKTSSTILEILSTVCICCCCCCVCVRGCVHVCVFLYACVHACLFVCCMCTYVFAWVHMCYACIYAFVHVCVHILFLFRNLNSYLMIYKWLIKHCLLMQSMYILKGRYIHRHNCFYIGNYHLTSHLYLWWLINWLMKMLNLHICNHSLYSYPVSVCM